ncbi:dihydroneopterin aldolase [Amylibacter kogurei]|uniref:Dihydroneopterin aldolase n=1 Tax=Paramylibacter kogurei TaxID=1889778 RepID=A0A2G5K6D3_9RHOB|nr:disulfide bond formation protein B [Amylibacter kogurei]PIB24985.1 dihydroneopterin aldolase [Amylibacter kogurei]
MTKQQLVLIATLGSVALLGGALAFQYLGGLPPCKMCYWQRWPHLIAIAFGALALFTRKQLFAIGGLLAAATTSGIGFYHAGVEQKWWQGPTTCTSSSNAGLSSTELLDKIMNAPLVRCDEIPWDLFGISMAGWNGIISLGIVVIWAAALRR